MKIINIDAPRYTTENFYEWNIIQFVLEVIRPLELTYYKNPIWHYLLEVTRPHIKALPLSPIWEFQNESYENIAVLIHTIPIYLRDSRPEKVQDEDSMIDPSGAYYPNRNGDSPYIELYLSPIYKDSQNDDKYFKWLFTKVLLHELAHAALDEGGANIKEKISYQSEFWKWREESMANAVALRIIKDYGDKDFYDYAKQFMLSQSPEYALGVKLEGCVPSDFNGVFEGKIRGVNQELQDKWLDYVKGSPDWEGLRKWNSVLSSKKVYSFNGKYYLRVYQLLRSIVVKVLSDFETQNGRKMTYDEFKSIFPCIKTRVGMAYEITDDVKRPRSLYLHIQLEDANCSLYCNGWDKETLYKFIANTNIELKEYQNWYI